MTAAAAARAAASPYRGLTHFTEDDAALFFGRARERDLVISNLKARRLTVVYGESGVGKSSLLRAGVVHDLREMARGDFDDPDFGRPEYVPVIAASWSDDPLRTLRDSLVDAVAPFVRGAVRPPTSGSLDAAIDELAEQADARLLVILDQLEEYFLYHPDEAGEGTLAYELPRALVRPHLRASFLLSIREDALAKLDRFQEEVPGLFDTVLRIGPLDRESARAAIVGPLRAFTGPGPKDAETALVDAVLDQVASGALTLEGSGQGRVERDGGPADAGPIEAPYLQLVLARLWEEEDDPAVLRLATLERLGGSEAIVRTHLDGALAGFPEPERAVAADALRYLVTPSGTKIALTAEDIASFTGHDDVAPVLEKLTGSRVRILRAVGAPPGQPSLPRYEIFHDVLGGAVLDWRSRYAREQERLDLERRAAAEREQLEQEKREAEQREQEERRRARTFRAVAGAALALLVAACAILGYALVQKSRAQHAQHVSAAEALAAQVRNELGDGRLAAAIPSALSAYDRAPTTAAQDALVDAIQQTAGLRRLIRFPAPVEGTAVAPDGGAIAVGTGRTVELRDGRGAPIATMTEPADVHGVAFSPRGDRLAAARGDGAVALYRVRRDGSGRATGLGRVPLATQPAGARAVAFSPDGRWLAAGTQAGVVVWRLGAKAAPTLLQPAGDFARAVAFCPGRRGRAPAVAAALEDGRVVLWPSAAAPARSRLLQGARSLKEGAVACSPDGLTVAAAGDDRIVTLFRLGGSAPPVRLGGHTDGIEALAFSADGGLLASGADDHSVILWDVRQGHERQLGRRLLAHTQPVVAVGFDRDGATLAAGSGDGRVSVWDPAELARAGGGIEVTDDRVRDASFGGRVFAAATAGGRVLVRDALDPGRQGRVPEAQVDARTIALDPAGGWIALGFGNTVQLFRLRDGIPEGTKQPLAGATGVGRIAVARNGRLAAALPDGAIRLWGAPPRTKSFVVLHPPGKPGSACALAIASDGGAVAAAYGAPCQNGVRGSHVVLWRGGERPVVLPGALGGVTDVEFSRGGTALAAAGTDAIGVWDVASGRMRDSLPAGANVVGFSPDGRWLASNGSDGSVRVWDVVGHRQIGNPLPTPPHVDATALAFIAPSTLAAAYQDGTAAVWNLDRWRIRNRLGAIARSLRDTVDEGGVP